MNFEKTQSEGLKSTFHIVVPASDVETAVNEKLTEIGKTVKMPGFRPGRVPMPVLKSRFRPQALAEAQQSAMNTAVGKLLEDEGITPAVQPSVTGEPKLVDGEDMEFDLEIEALPKIELTDFSALELELLKVEPTEDEITARLEELGQQAARPAKVARNRKLKNGDIAHINFNGTVDGEERPGMKGEGFDLELGSGQFIPGFEEQLVGVKGGENIDVTVTFPEDYQAEELQGVEAVFAVEVLEVREKKALKSAMSWLRLWVAAIWTICANSWATTCLKPTQAKPNSYKSASCWTCCKMPIALSCHRLWSKVSST